MQALPECRDRSDARKKETGPLQQLCSGPVDVSSEIGYQASSSFSSSWRTATMKPAVSSV